MSQSHYWFSTDNDYRLIVEWLDAEGAEPDGGSFAATQQKEIVLTFPSIGSIVHWPEEIRLSEYPESSQRWRDAVIARDWMQRNTGRKLVDVDQSAVAKLCPPYQKTEGLWVGGELHFPGSKLKDRFPKLHALCGRFERWLRKQPLVYDNTKKDRFSPFEESLCTSGILKKIFAFPEAHGLLRAGSCMCEWSASDFVYAKFLRRLELQGKID
jgi:hypothetical protein